MADERDFQLLDDYLTNRMSEQQKSAFGQKLQADPDLKNEFMLQQRLVKGIQNARVAELKSMLNKIPVSAAGPEQTLASKFLLGALISILIAGAAYWYFKDSQEKIAQPEAPAEEEVIENQVTPASEPEVEKSTEKETPRTIEPGIVEKDKNQTSAGTEHSKPSQAQKPAPLSAPKEKTPEEQSQLQVPVPDVLNPKSSSLIVETDTENRSYNFHYQFKDGKLFLFGPFEENLYEIMEFFSGDKRTAFLYYNNNYYLLDENGFQIKPLTTITDSALLEKLKAHRGTK